MNLSQYMLINVMLNKKEYNCIPCKHKPFCQLITLVYFDVIENFLMKNGQSFSPGLSNVL